MQATISSKGQVTLPKALRERLHLTAGDRLEFIIDEKGDVRLILKRRSVRKLKRVLPRPEKAVTLEEMEKVIEQGASGQ